MSKTRRALRRSKRFGVHVIAFTIFCLLIVASFGRLKLKQKSASYQQREEELMALITSVDGVVKFDILAG